MNQRARFYSKINYDISKLKNKPGEITFQRADFLVTARGEFMVAGPNANGLCEVMFQYAEPTESKWVRIYIGQKFVDRLRFPESEEGFITCEDVLENGLDLNILNK